MSPVIKLAEDQPILTQQDPANRRFDIGRVAVLGAATMGSRIAAHLTNAGLRVRLLDRVSEKGDRNGIAVQAVKELIGARPAAFATPSLADNITVGNFEDDLHTLLDCDWIIEAVAENLEIKRLLLGRVVEHLHPNAILTTNTSGLPVAQIGAPFPRELRQRWLGTHFFNPPRYMRLLELIATPETEPEAVAAIADFCDRRLGKVVVPANDVPNFIANRLGVFLSLNTFKIMQEQGLSIEEVDLLTGPVLGWPKTGTFRLADMVGIDVLVNTAKNFLRSIVDERSDLKIPMAMEEVAARGWLGDKAKQGLYKKERGADGREIRAVLDPQNMVYRPSAKPVFPSVERVKGIDLRNGRLRALLDAAPESDKAVAFLRRTLSELWAYSANRIGEVASSLVDIDRAMTAGYNWQLGPFALWDSVGVPITVEWMRADGLAIPAAAEKLLASGGASWYRADGGEYFDVLSGGYRAVPRNPDLNTVASYKRSGHGRGAGAFAGNESVSLVDIGEGVGCFEFHSKMNSLDFDLVSFLIEHLLPDSDAVRNFHAFIVGNDAPDFSVGANLAQLAVAIQNQDWAAIDLRVRQFQEMTRAIKFCIRPVVAAPSGMCLGGGAEIALHSALRQPHLELYAGLVESGVGLVPSGGGCKELLLRALAAADAVRGGARAESVEVIGAVKSVFETISMAKVSTSALDARSLRMIASSDSISMNRLRLIGDARTQALQLTRSGYLPPVPRSNIPAPGDSILATLKLGAFLAREGGYISEHDVKVANHIARILTGGDVTAGTQLSEQMVLDLEREAFLSLCGEPRTMERIEFTLKTGKPLRN